MGGKSTNLNISINSNINENSIPIINTSNNSSPNFKYVKKPNISRYNKLISEKIEKMSYQNQNNKINQFFSLEVKDFEKPIYNKKIKITDNQVSVQWKEYLLTYLKSEEKTGAFWASDLSE